MLAARDGKHNIVEKLLDLGAAVADQDNVSWPSEAIFSLLKSLAQLKSHFSITKRNLRFSTIRVHPNNSAIIEFMLSFLRF